MLRKTPEAAASIRGQKVMLDSDLAELYQVPTKVVNQAVRRNLDPARIEKIEATQHQHISVIAVVVDEIKKLKSPPGSAEAPDRVYPVIAERNAKDRPL